MRGQRRDGKCEECMQYSIAPRERQVQYESPLPRRQKRHTKGVGKARHVEFDPRICRQVYCTIAQRGERGGRVVGSHREIEHAARPEPPNLSVR
jgi:hypothetical protein